MTLSRWFALAVLTLGVACGRASPAPSESGDLFLLDASESTRSEVGIVAWGITVGGHNSTIVRGYDAAHVRTIELEHETRAGSRPTFEARFRRSGALATMKLESGAAVRVTHNSFAGDAEAGRAVARMVADLETQPLRPAYAEGGGGSKLLASDLVPHAVRLVERDVCLQNGCATSLQSSALQGARAVDACQSTAAERNCNADVSSASSAQTKATSDCQCGAAACPNGSNSERFAGISWDEADKLFRSDKQWLGGDAAGSIRLGSDKTLWLFGDSYISNDGKRALPFVHNSIALQQGSNPQSANMSFGWKKAQDGSASEIFPNRDGIWHWPTHGARRGDDGPVFVFLSAIKTDSSVLGFAHVGYRIARLDNVDGAASDIRVEYLPDPPQTSMLVGLAAIVQDDHLVVFARSNDAVQGGFPGYLARYKWQDLLDKKVTPEFWNGSGWGGANEARQIMNDIGAECSVHYDSSSQKWIHVATQGIGRTGIFVRTASDLQGPWSDGVDSFRPSESQRNDDKILVYAAKAHSELTAPSCDELLVTYVTNKSDGTIPADDLYYPRFVRLQRK